MNYFHDMVGNIHQKRIWRPWNQCRSICLHLPRHIWNSRTSESSGHDSPAWTKAQPSPSRRSHRNTNRPAEARIYHNRVELVISMERTVCIWNSNFKHTAWPTSLTPREADDAGLAQFDFTGSVSRKTGTRIFATRGGSDCDTCHQDKVVTWQWRLRWLSKL